MGKHLLEEYLNQAESLKNQICVANFGDSREQSAPTDKDQMRMEIPTGDTREEGAGRRQ